MTLSVVWEEIALHHKCWYCHSIRHWEQRNQYIKLSTSVNRTVIVHVTMKILLDVVGQQHTMWLQIIYPVNNKLPCTVYAIYFVGVLFSRISRVGCYSRFQQHAKINFPPIPAQECDLCIRNTNSTVHSARANECKMKSEWYWFLRPPSMIALLLDREFNHSRKCLEVPIRKKLDSQNIWRIQYFLNALRCRILVMSSFSTFNF